MHASTAIKWLHRATTLVLLMLTGAYLLYQHSINSPPDDRLWRKKPLTEDITLYITKYNGGGATVSDVYRYYLGNNTLKLEQLGESEPFLVSDTGSARVNGSANTVSVVLTGRVYSFTNSVLVYSGGVAILPAITLHATGEP